MSTESVTETAAIVKAICAVMKAVNAVGKDGTNPHHGYKYASVEGLVSALKPAMADNGLALIPECTTPVTIEHGKTSSGKTWWRTDAVVRYRLFHVSGQSIQIEVAGSGVDDGDKGIYKALSGALKYALCESFMIPRLDDPDADSPTHSGSANPIGEIQHQEHVTRQSSSALEVQLAGEGPKQYVKNWKDFIEHDEGIAYLTVCPSGFSSGKPWSKLADKDITYYIDAATKRLEKEFDEKATAVLNAAKRERRVRNDQAATIHAKQMASEEIPF